MVMPKPYTQFDLPARHIPGDHHYVPPRARQRDEIDRRRALPRGTILLEQQHRGLQVAQALLEAAHDENDVAYVSLYIATCGLNSAWYQCARNSRFMRRHTALPYIAQREEQPAPTTDSLLASTRSSFARITRTAGVLATYHAKQQPNEPLRADAFGRATAHAALSLACIPVLDTLQSGSVFHTQAAVRAHALATLDTARSIGAELGSPPSFAQLADPDSDMSVHIRRTARSEVFYALEAAQDMYAMPR